MKMKGLENPRQQQGEQIPLDFGIDIENIPERDNYLDYSQKERDALIKALMFPQHLNISPSLKQKLERFEKLNHDFLGGDDVPYKH